MTDSWATDFQVNPAELRSVAARFEALRSAAHGASEWACLSSFRDAWEGCKSINLDDQLAVRLSQSSKELTAHIDTHAQTMRTTAKLYENNEEELSSVLKNLFKDRLE